jgi:hypothetical protein
MSMGLSQSDAGTRVSAYAVAQRARASWEQVKAMAAADRMQVEAARVVNPAPKLVETPAQIREQVMADRGLDRRDLAELGAQARLEAEISIAAETARRARDAKIKSQGNFVDLSV